MPKKRTTTRKNDDKTFTRTLIFILILLVSPIVVSCLILASVYKILCFAIIKWKDKNFIKFLDSFDVFWCLEDDASRSKITVLGYVESECAQDLLTCIKEKLLRVGATGDSKIFYRKMEKYGFFYWKKPESIAIDEYTKIIDFPIECDKLDVKNLELMLANLSKQVLPLNGDGMFQIFITNKKVVQSDGSREKHAIICRIHHALGDGIALIQFLCQEIGEKISTDGTGPEIYKDLTGGDLFVIIQKSFQILISLANIVLRKVDDNSLHGPKLSGRCLFKWTDENQNLNIMVKEIKNHVEGVKFSDVILAALSQSLQNYFKKTMDHVPQHVAVIIPVRQTAPYRDQELGNNFSINVLDLPISENLAVVSECGKRLRETADSLTHSCYVKLCSILPNCFLEPLMESKHATLSFSNIPGPVEINICGGHKLKSMVFFAANKGTTGFGVTALSYGGVLRIGVSADTAIISDPKDLGLILDGIVAEIKLLHSHYVIN